MHTLLMLLVGPMQSWGHRSRFDDRDTGLEPTRSGVVGLLCAAMGIPRDGDLSLFNELRMGVRVDAPGRPLVDYQTAMNVRRADGSGLENVQSWRHYLSDARFLVGLAGPDLDFLRQLEAALRNPKWPLFLGRKSFVLSLPPHLPDSSVLVDTDVEDALRSSPWFRLRSREDMPDSLRLVVETKPGEEGMSRNDWPLDFTSQSRRFSLRTVLVQHLAGEDRPPDGGEILCTSPS